MLNRSPQLRKRKEMDPKPKVRNQTSRILCNPEGENMQREARQPGVVDFLFVSVRWLTNSVQQHHPKTAHAIRGRKHLAFKSDPNLSAPHHESHLYKKPPLNPVVIHPPRLFRLLLFMENHDASSKHAGSASVCSGDTVLIEPRPNPNIPGQRESYGEPDANAVDINGESTGWMPLQ